MSVLVLCVCVKESERKREIGYRTVCHCVIVCVGVYV